MRMVQKIMFASVLAIFGSAFILSHPANAAETKCAIFSFKAEDGSTKNTDQVCVNDFDKDGKIKTNPYFGDGGGGWRKVEVTENGQKKTRPGLSVDGKNIVYYTNVGPVKLQATGKTWDDFVGQLSSALSSDMSLIAYDKDCVGVAVSKCGQKKLQFVGATKKNFKDSAAPKKIPDTGSSYDKIKDTPTYQPASSGNTSTPAQANEAAKQQASEDAEATSADGDDDAAAACFNNTGALGWVICSVINFGGPALTKMINTVIEPLLQVDVRVFSADSNALVGAWQQFQVIANFAFVAIFMIVIFSQLTGVGIDNYGIKKILPQLIVGAILINASFIICQLAVEVSNILGLGVKNLFQGISSNISTVTVTTGDGQSTQLALTGKETLGMGVVLLAVMGFGVAALVSAGPLIIILALIALVVAVIFLFVLLAVRQSLAVLLVVISPIAFATYLLPGTKKLVFDKWLGLFKGLLIAFPLISLVLYGGQAVARILVAANSNNLSYSLLLGAAIASVAPVFFVPSLIMKSLGSLEAVAKRVRSAMPTYKSLSSNAKSGRGIGKIGAVKNLQQYQNDREREKQVKQASKRASRLETRKGLVGKYAGGTAVGRSMMKSYDRRARSALNTVNAAKNDEFETNKAVYFNSLSDSEIAKGFKEGSLLSTGGKFDSMKTLAGLDSIYKDSDFYEAYAAATLNSDFQNEMGSNAEFRKSVNAMLAKRGAQGIAIAKTNEKVAGGKQTIDDGNGGEKRVSSFSMGKDSDFRKAYEKNLASMPADTFDSTKKDALETIDIGGEKYSLMSAAKPEQLAHIVSRNLTGGDGEALTKHLESLSSDQRAAVAGNLSGAGVTGATAHQIMAMGDFDGDAYAAGEALINSGGDLNLAAEALAQKDGNGGDAASYKAKLEAAVLSFQQRASNGITDYRANQGDYSNTSPVTNVLLNYNGGIINQGAGATLNNPGDLRIDHGSGSSSSESPQPQPQTPPTQNTDPRRFPDQSGQGPK